MRHLLAICVLLFANAAHAKTYQYTGGSVTEFRHYMGPGQPTQYEPVGPSITKLSAVFEADLAPGTTTEVGSVRIVAGPLHAIGYGDVTTDDDGNIVDWYLSAYVGGSDYAHFELKTHSEELRYRYEFACTGSSYCIGTELIKLNAEGGSWAVVPVPASLLLLVSALGALAVARRRAA